MSRVEPNRNVYVGHRYVPKIFGEWDKKNQYEGLSIVTHQGNSYTSKKRVPVGIDILNEEFWVVTGNYNAQVEDYREEVRQLSSDVTVIDQKLDTKSDITYVDTELGKKSDKTYVDTELGKKSDITYVDTELGKKSDQSYVDTELDKKTDLIDTAVDYYIPDDYVSLQSAIDDIKLKHSSGVRVRITIRRDHKPKMSLLLRDTILPNVMILSEDNIVKVSDNMGTNTNLIDVANSYGLFFNCLVDLEGKGGHGIYLHGGSYIRISPNCGVINAGYDGLNVRQGSTAIAINSVFTGASQNSSDGAGISAWGGTVMANGADVSNSKYYGARSAHGGTLDFDDGIANNCFRHGIRASMNGRVTCRRAQAKNCGTDGIYALNGSQINALEADASNSGSAGFYAMGASMINAREGIADGSDYGVRAGDGSTVNFRGGSLSNIKTHAVEASNSSTIEARNVVIEGSQAQGIVAMENSLINAQACRVYGSGGRGIYASGSSRINCPVSTVRNTQPTSPSAHGVVASEFSEINISRSSVWNNGGNDLRVSEGGKILARGTMTDSGKDLEEPEKNKPKVEDVNVGSFNELTFNGYILA